jgi:hypothetical protein
MNAAFTLVYTFAARTTSMEMNFPHKSLDQTIGNVAQDGAAQRAAHDALLACAIARQALSLTARTYVAHKNGRRMNIVRSRSNAVEDRIRLFSGRFSENNGDSKVTEIRARFVAGHFRPDLAAEHMSSETALTNL